MGLRTPISSLPDGLCQKETASGSGCPPMQSSVLLGAEAEIRDCKRESAVFGLVGDAIVSFAGGASGLVPSFHRR